MVVAMVMVSMVMMMMVVMHHCTKVPPSTITTATDNLHDQHNLINVNREFFIVKIFSVVDPTS